MHVIYEKYSEGTFQGKLNGVRKYNVDFTKSEVKMGTFHILDGRKWKVFYRGNRSICGWCHGDASKYPGGHLNSMKLNMMIFTEEGVKATQASIQVVI